MPQARFPAGLARAAPRDGVTALLFGESGDEVVGQGIARLQELTRSVRPLELWRAARRVGRCYGFSMPARSMREDRFHRWMSPDRSIGSSMADRLYRHFGIEQQHPFSDLRVLEYCIGLPPEQSLNRTVIAGTPTALPAPGRESS